MNRLLIIGIVFFVFLTGFLKLQSTKLENKILQCKSEIKDLEALDLSITNKALETNVEIKIKQTHFNKPITNRNERIKWVQLFKERRAYYQGS